MTRTMSLDELIQLVEQHPSTQRVLKAIEDKNWALTEDPPKWRRSEPQLYVRYSTNDPITETSSRNYQTGERLGGLSSNPLTPETAFPVNGRTVGDFVAQQSREYEFMKGLNFGADNPSARTHMADLMPWIVEGVEVGRGPDNEPLIRPLRTIGQLADDAARG